MMHIRPWSRMPTQWIADGRIKLLTWKEDKAAGTAALVLFVALCHLAVERAALPRVQTRRVPGTVRSAPARVFSQYAAHLQTMPPRPPVPVQPEHGFVQAALDASGLAAIKEMPEGAVDYIAHASYDQLGHLTGLSRKLIAAGLTLLVQQLMIERVGSARSGDYRIQDLEPGYRWAKLPGQALLSAGKTSFEPLTRFDLRSKYALAAMKLYCYYASARDSSTAYSHPSFETSFERTGVAERDIPRANSLLLSVGLLAMYHRPSFAEGDYEDGGDEEGTAILSANRYYMTGYKSFFAKGRGGRPAAAEGST